MSLASENFQTGRNRATLQSNRTREEIEKELSTDLFYVLDVVRQFDAVHDDPAPLMLFQSIDAPNQG